MSRLRTINIGLEVEATDRTNESLHAMEQTFKRINDNAKNMNFDEVTKDIDKLRHSIEASAAAGDDISQQMGTYTKSVSKAVQELDKQAVSLRYQLTEQGKADRARLAQLELIEHATKAEAKEREALRRTVIQASEAEIQEMIKRNKQARVNLKLSTLELRENTKSRKTLKDLVKADLASLSERIKKQKEYIKTLMTTEGRYKMLKKVSVAGMKTGVKAAGGALALGTGIVGGLVAGAVGAVDKVVDKEKAAKRIKGRWNTDERNQMLDDLYISTGADYTTIVDAINRVQTVLGRNANRSDIHKATIAEIQYPGSAALFQSNSQTNSLSGDFTRLRATFANIQKTTGAGDDVIQNGIQAAQASRLGNGRLSQSEYVALYAALKTSNAFDSDEQITQALESFARHLKPSDDVFQAFGEYDFTRFARGAQNRNQLAAGLASIDTNDLRRAVQWNFGVDGKSSAQNTAEKMRLLQQKKDQLLIKLIAAVEPIIDKLAEWADSGIIDKVMNGLLFFFQHAAGWIEMIMEAVEGIAEFFGVETKKEPTDVSQQTVSGNVHAQGGIISMPSIVGERGSELVIPLDYARLGRSTQIVQTFTQSFNIAPSPTVASMAQSVRGSRWANNFIQARV